MISRQNNNCPSPEKLSQLLVPHTPLDDGLDRHLASCSTCQETLCDLAGEATWWERASVLATSIPSRNWGATICALSSSTAAGRADDPLCEHELQQLQSMLQPASHPELIGRLGRYELEQLVGRGGMGLVFRARDVELHRIVAVKTLAVHLLPFGAARDRFVREARATASLTHPHIVPVFDVITDGAVPAIVMQYIAGPTLEAKILEAGPFPWTEVLQIGIQLADALALAHDRELVHRDIKPGNVLLEADGSRALLTDFGLVRALDDATLTRSGVLAGTPDYMSPEQARGEAVTHSSDLFSLGSVLYAMLTGHPPFRAENPMAVMNRICHQKPRALTEFDAGVPLELVQVVDRLLAKVPRKRFESAEELATRLRRLASSPRRLKMPPGRFKKIGFVLAIAAVLAVLGLSLREKLMPDSSSTRATTPGYAAGRAANSDVGKMGSSSAGYFSPMPDPELLRLDEQIAALKLDTDRIMSRVVRMTPKNASFPSPHAPIDRASEQIRQDLRRLELDIRFAPSTGAP